MKPLLSELPFSRTDINAITNAKTDGIELASSAANSITHDSTILPPRLSDSVTRQTDAAFSGNIFPGR